jgi:hypothetical protein
MSVTTASDLPIRRHSASSGELYHSDYEGGFDRIQNAYASASFVISASTFAMIIMGWGGTTGLSPVAYVCSAYPYLYYTSAKDQKGASSSS